MKHPLSKHYRSFLLNTPMGVAIGIISTCLLGWVFSSDFSEGMTKFYTYVVSTVLSLLVASFAVAGVFSNIASQREKDEDTRKRKLLAARSKLPLALSTAYSVFAAGVHFSASFDRLSQDNGLDRIEEQSLARMNLPDETISTFWEVIEHHDNEEVAERISSVLAEYQVYAARWSARFQRRSVNRSVGESETRWNTVSWAYLANLTETLFEYAREGSDLGIVTQGTLDGVLRRELPDWDLSDFYEEEIDRYARVFHRRFA